MFLLSSNDVGKRMSNCDFGITKPIKQNVISKIKYLPFGLPTHFHKAV